MRRGISRARPAAPWSRRQFLAAAAALPLVPAALAQSPGIRLRKLYCCELRVSDIGRSTEFYQGLFGMSAWGRSRDSFTLRVAEDGQFVRLRPLLEGETPGIAHIGYSVDDWSPERLLTELGEHGFTRIEPPPRSAPGIEHAMQAWLRTDGGREEVYFADPQGLIVQLTYAGDCGGAACGEQAPEPAGRLPLSEFNHFTVFSGDGAAANDFYADLFGLAVQSYQGPGSPVLGIGDGYQFVMYAGFGGGQTPANIHHGCFNMPDFDVDAVRAVLTDFGLSERDEGPAGPLVHYVSLRMPARGGAEGGTPELYFTDPDGILMQLQDVSYCGGGGYLGSECLSGEAADG